MITRFRIPIVIASVSIAASSSGAQELHATSRPDARERNPRHLDAAPLVEQNISNNVRRFRFEWDQVPGATQYVLSGKWTTPRSWTVHATEFRVTPQVARQWNDDRVTVDATLPAGNHSWGVVAVFRSPASGDFEHPTITSFVVR